MVSIKNPQISLIAALGNQRQIGKKGKLLWRIPEDMKHLRDLTIGHPIIMGRKTWDSIPEERRPLPERTNIVITRNPEYTASGAIVTNSLEEALKEARDTGQGEIFIFGGGEIYQLAMPLAVKLYLTLVDSSEEGDTFFPEYEEEFELINQSNKKTAGDVEYTFSVFKRK